MKQLLHRINNSTATSEEADAFLAAFKHLGDVKHMTTDLLLTVIESPEIKLKIAKSNLFILWLKSRIDRRHNPSKLKIQKCYEESSYVESS